MSDLTEREIEFLKYFQKEAASKWKEILIKTPAHSLTKDEIFQYYSRPTIRAAIMQQLKKGPSTVIQHFTHTEPVLKRWEKGSPIHIKKDSGEVDDPEDYSYWVERRAVEFHPSYGRTTKEVHVDLDPHPTYGWNNTKKMAGRIADILYDHPDIYSKTIRFSGGTGFYILGELNKELPIDEARKLVQSVLEPLRIEKSIVLNQPAKKGQIRLDTSTLHDKGSIRGLYSLNGSTGLVSIPVEEEHLATFKPEDALPFSVTGEFSGRTKSLRP